VGGGGDLKMDARCQMPEERCGVSFPFLSYSSFISGIGGEVTRYKSHGTILNTIQYTIRYLIGRSVSAIAEIW